MYAPCPATCQQICGSPPPPPPPPPSPCSDSSSVSCAPVAAPASAPAPPSPQPRLEEADVLGALETSHRLASAGMSSVFIPPLRLGSCGVYARVYIGSTVNACDARWVEQAGITHVLNCADETVPARPYHPPPRKYLQLDAKDVRGYPLLRLHAAKAFAFLNDALRRGSGSVLVNCYAGLNRSVTLVLAYLVATEPQVPLLALIKRVGDNRPGTLTNPDFVQQLVQFFNAIQDTRRHCWEQYHRCRAQHHHHRRQSSSVSSVSSVSSFGSSATPVPAPAPASVSAPVMAAACFGRVPAQQNLTAHVKAQHAST